jgi:hypothetical protein
LIPKIAVSSSLSFLIVRDNGKYYFRDLSLLSIEKVPNVRLNKSEPAESSLLLSGDYVSFFNNTIYLVEETARSLKLKLIKEITPYNQFNYPKNFDPTKYIAPSS